MSEIKLPGFNNSYILAAETLLEQKGKLRNARPIACDLATQALQSLMKYYLDTNGIAIHQGCTINEMVSKALSHSLFVPTTLNPEFCNMLEKAPERPSFDSADNQWMYCSEAVQAYHDLEVIVLKCLEVRMRPGDYEAEFRYDPQMQFPLIWALLQSGRAYDFTRLRCVHPTKQVELMMLILRAKEIPQIKSISVFGEVLDWDYDQSSPLIVGIDFDRSDPETDAIKLLDTVRSYSFPGTVVATVPYGANYSDGPRQSYSGVWIYKRDGEDISTDPDETE